VEIILTHENADFDAVAALLAAHKLHPTAVPLLPERLNHNVASFITLYQQGLPFVRQRDWDGQPDGIILVDTQRVTQIKPNNLPVTIIDHHPPSHDLPAGWVYRGDSVGAATTLLVEQIRAAALPLTSIEATLLTLGIYEDTGSLSYGGTTPRDLLAAAWLIERGAVLDTVRRYLTPPLNDDQQALLEALVKAAESRVIEGYTIIVSAVEVDHYISEISSVAHRLRDTLDPAALFILVQMPETLQLVARSTVDAIDVGEVARALGGGGHGRASAAPVNGMSCAEAVVKIWREVVLHIQPETRVRDLMSNSIHTVDAARPIAQIASQLRRIGHEGYPVVENGQVVGLLTRRDLDRALEHGLGKLTAREVMSGGNIVAHPNDSVLSLEQQMVESGWGQIPVAQDGKLIGIVTRTDLIKHWARVHPPAPPSEPHLPDSQIEAVLGPAAAALIRTVAGVAQEHHIALYLVGGVVRDLLLKRPNFDIDFVAEGSAIKLAEMLRTRYGGKISSFTPFGTAKWEFDEAAARSLGLSLADLPHHVDFATARNEFYEHPTALPTVYDSSIKLDLHRRDFTINTLAVQLSPAAGRVLDFYGGLSDLRAGLIRALHSLSFVDDPTRVLRAVRFAGRLRFTIEPRTAELITTALPMLGRITGERLRNELELLLGEATPENGLMELQARGALVAIHPAFVLSPRIGERFRAARNVTVPWEMASINLIQLYWHLLAVDIPTDKLPAWSERLMFSHGMAESMLHAARIVQHSIDLRPSDLRPSQIVPLLEGIPDLALAAAWLAADDIPVRERVRRYQLEWRYVRPHHDGNTLKAMGLTPGRCFGVILSRLRAACLDGEITDEAGEESLIQQWVREEGLCDDHP
jgi:tRNA nucleotidyltransferase (CCA-adding enzyme)